VGFRSAETADALSLLSRYRGGGKLRRFRCDGDRDRGRRDSEFESVSLQQRVCKTICSSASRRSWPRRSVKTALGSPAKEPTCLPAGRRCGSRPAARARSFCADPHGIGIIDLDSVGLRPVARQMPALPTIVLAVVAEEISAVPTGNPQSAAAVAPDSPCALPRHGRVRDRGDAGLAEMLPLVAACRSWRRQGSDRLCLLG